MQMTDIQMSPGGRLHVPGSRSGGPHANGHSDGAVGPNLFFEERRIDAVLQRHEQTIVVQVRHHGRQSIRCVIRPHGDEADIEFALDLTRKNDVNFDIEGTVRYIYLQPLLADCRYMLLVDVDESKVVTRTSESSADDAADRSGSDHNHTHGVLRPHVSRDP